MSENTIDPRHRAQPDLLMPQAVLSCTAADLAAKYTGVFSAQTVDARVRQLLAELTRPPVPA